jgi:DNA repair protein RadC
MYKDHNIPIKSWAEDDRPREKFILKGRQALSNAELLAILIGSGSRHKSAVELCRTCLQENDNRLTQLGKKSVEELTRIKGIGPAKAVSILAALELGRRCQSESPQERITIQGSQDAFNTMSPALSALTYEEFHVLLLDRSNKVIRQVKVSSGGVSGTVVDPKIIFKTALDLKASGIILSHNHPSGNLKPSQADIALTKKVKEGGKLVDILILDHIIVTTDGYFSFADEGLL